MVWRCEMRFHFALEAVLRVRSIREDQQRNRLLAANAECDRLRSQLDAIEQDHARRKAMVSAQMISGMWGAELQYDAECRRQAQTLRARVLVDLEQAGKRARQENEKYLSLRRDRRAMEALRDDAQRQFELEQRRREQLALDEMFLLSRGRGGQTLPSD